jgi:hypothetical protein
VTHHVGVAILATSLLGTLVPIDGQADWETVFSDGTLQVEARAQPGSAPPLRHPPLGDGERTVRRPVNAGWPATRVQATSASDSDR